MTGVTGVTDEVETDETRVAGEAVSGDAGPDAAARTKAKAGEEPEATGS